MKTLKNLVNIGISKPVIKLLKQGMTPEKLAFTVAIGAVLAVFPVLGSTTILCTLAAMVLGLNLPVIQVGRHVNIPIGGLFKYSAC